ncbi:MAG: M23 family metallopeptidase [Nanoarchaeota archaeon]
MKVPLRLTKYLFLISLGLGTTNKTFSPDIKGHTSYTFSELNEMNLRKEKQFIINELNKPVLDFYSPVDTGQISCVYGYRKIKDKTEFHKGIDIGIVGNASLKFAQRPDVLSVAPGIVDFAGNENGYGKIVKIKHNNNIETIYAHLNNFFVEKGDTVLSGQKIGEMGKNGNARSNKKGSKIHLHFEARKNNKPFNPNKYFKNYKKIGIDDTLYCSIAYLPDKNVKTRDEEIILNEMKKDLPIFNFFNLNSSKKVLPHMEDLVPPMDTPLDAESFYEIQIAASLKKLNDNEIKKLEKMYGSTLKENEINGMYKYSIKQFKSLEDALGFRNSLNSKENLGILVYKNDKISETKWNF